MSTVRRAYSIYYSALYSCTVRGIPCGKNGRKHEIVSSSDKARKVYIIKTAKFSHCGQGRAEESANWFNFLVSSATGDENALYKTSFRVSWRRNPTHRGQCRIRDRFRCHGLIILLNTRVDGYIVERLTRRRYNVYNVFVNIYPSPALSSSENFFIRFER